MTSKVEGGCGAFEPLALSPHRDSSTKLYKTAAMSHSRPKPMSAVMTRRMSVGPGSGKPRRAYSAYTVQNEPGRAARYDQPRSGREWWRSFLRVRAITWLWLINCVCF